MAMTESYTAQARAAELVLHGSPFERLRAGVGATRSLLRDPEDTTQVLILGMMVNRAAFPKFFAAFLEHPEGMWIFKNRPAIDSSEVDYDALRALPDDTLGREYVRFIDTNALDPDFFQAPPGAPEAAAIIAKRLRQAHDIWHVVTGYDTTVPDEVALQAFTAAQTGMPSAKLIALFGTLRWGPNNRGMWRDVIRGYRRGKRARAFSPLRWETRWALPLEDVRAELDV
ncbi:MAG: ubiquinone biosynthesis protein COQ4 [Myxococcota bacterium]|jgi:ubiquinone biosynthesis protein COQ4